MVGELNFGLLDQNAPARAAGSFQQGQVNRLALEQGKQEQAMNALALRQRQQGMADVEAERSAYAQAGGDASKLGEAFRSAGLHKQAMEIEGQQAAAQAAAKKAQIEEGLKHVEVLRDFMGRVSDQASLDATRQQIAGIYGPDAAERLPAVYNPTEFEGIKKQSLDAKAQLEQHWKEADYQLNQRKQGFTESQGAQDIALRKQSLAQSAAQHAQAIGLEREKLGASNATTGPAAAAKASEDERKAAGWLNQADNAYKNMIGAMKKAPGSEAPGLGEAIAPEAIKGAFRSESRQQFTQAASSLSEALLRAATGAGVNESEAKQKIEELTPSYLDKPANREQKLAAIPMYIESLKARAGRAAPVGYVTPTRGAALPGGWSVEEH